VFRTKDLVHFVYVYRYRHSITYCFHCGLLLQRSGVVCGHTTVSWTKTDEPIEMACGAETCVRPRNHALDGGAYWRLLASTIDRYARWQWSGAAIIGLL